MSRGTIVILSTSNLIHNVNVLSNIVAPAGVIAIVKANAYGHGLLSVCTRLNGSVNMFGVASIEEAIELKKIGIQTRIVLMQGVHSKEELQVALNENLDVVFHNFMQINWLACICDKFQQKIYSWIKVNTGMGRLGFDKKDVTNVYQRLLPLSKGNIGIMSHLSCADDITNKLNSQQIESFTKIIDEMNCTINVEHTGVHKHNKNLPDKFDKCIYSLCNSAAIFNYPQCFFDYVRPGIALYGVSPINNKIGADYGLKPVMTLQSRLISIQKLKRNEYVGYCAMYSCPKDMLVGIVAIGYGDGYPITMNHDTPVLVNKKRCRIIGRISMDMMAIDLKECCDAQIGDDVILWGNDLPIEHIAACTNNIVWDMLTGIQTRVKRYWIN